MIGVEERLPVITGSDEAGREHREAQLVRELGGVLAHLGKQRHVDAVLIVLDLVARDAFGLLELAVTDRVAVLLQLVDDARADPLADAAGVSQPLVVVGAGGARHHGGDALILGFYALERAVECRVHGGVQDGEVLLIQFHAGRAP
ncbi:hypothetical protein D9M68_799970 [compost metagenome]